MFTLPELCDAHDLVRQFLRPTPGAIDFDLFQRWVAAAPEVAAAA